MGGMLATLAGTDRGQILTTGARSPRRDATSALALGAQKGVHKKQHGCSEKSGCDRLPSPLRSGCRWQWLTRSDQTNNPCVAFRAVLQASDEHFWLCPSTIIMIMNSGCRASR